MPSFMRSQFELPDPKVLVVATSLSGTMNRLCRATKLWLEEELKEELDDERLDDEELKEEDELDDEELENEDELEEKELLQELEQELELEKEDEELENEELEDEELESDDDELEKELEHEEKLLEEDEVRTISTSISEICSSKLASKGITLTSRFASCAAVFCMLNIVVKV